MKKLKLYSVISALTAVILFGTAAVCNMCGITLDTSSTESAVSATLESKTSETVAETESASTEETSAETASESSADIELFDISPLAPVFAIANLSGDQLISFYSDENVTDFKELNGAIGDDGQFYNIEYDKKQASNDQDSFRVVAENFYNMGGYVYSVLEGNLVAGNSYFLCNSGVINENNLLTTASTADTALDQETKTQIEDIKGRSVQEGWIIDEYSNGAQVLIVVFEPDGNNYLMSIGLKTPDGIKLNDYPAVSDDGYSVWRVDDGGKVLPELYTIMFAMSTNDGLLLVVKWAGAEGENILLLLEKADSLELLPWEVYRYWSAA
jgi:hypothetical protein